MTDEERTAFRRGAEWMRAEALFKIISYPVDVQDPDHNPCNEICRTSHAIADRVEAVPAPDDPAIAAYLLTVEAQARGEYDR